MNKQIPLTKWTPLTRDILNEKKLDQFDVILISGDAYIDHPSFGTAVIARKLEKEGYIVGIIPQPNWRDDLRDFKKLGKPKYFFGVTAGSMDSIVNHYTASKRLRSTDAYTPGGAAGFRPDRAVDVYTNILKKLFPDTPVIIGGIEASLRRVTHYDYLENSLKPSILYSSKADLLIYGMGEEPVLELMKLLKKGIPFSSLKTIPQTAFLDQIESLPKNKKWDDFWISSHEECLKDKKSYALNFKKIEVESNKYQSSLRILQKIKDNISLVINPPFAPMSEKVIDASFDLPYTRLPHPKYKKRGGIPAFEMIKYSVNLHRGCFGGCSFCTISAHQGKFIASRSEKSIMKEVKALSNAPDFKGNLSDLGGPSANMYKLQGINLDQCKKCARPSCIYPKVCTNLNTDPRPLTNLYQKVDSLPYIKKAFVGSGVRYDISLSSPTFRKEHLNYLKTLITKHISGRFKVAPEHVSDNVLKIMRKPSFKLFYQLKSIFDSINKKEGKKQQLIPYFISSHPSSTLKDMAQLAYETKNLGMRLEQVQDFTPTPMTLSTVIYYSGINPYTLEKLYTSQSKKDKQEQNKFFFWYKKENKKWIKEKVRQLKVPYFF